MRRRSAQGDEFGSLELLLDTICNMFGLFIFVGMLVAVLASARSVVLQAQGAPAGADPLAADRQAVEDLRVRVEQAERAARPDARVEQARGQLASLQATNDQLERRAAAMERLTREGSERATALAAEMPRLRAEVERLRREVEAQSNVAGLQLRAPRRRTVEGLMPVQVVLWQGRAYWINPWIDRLDEPCRAWSEWNPDAVDLAAGPVCDVRECFRGGGQWLIRSVPLRADGGLPVREDDGAWRRSLLDLLARLQGDRHVVSLKVSPDSHAAFQQLREVIAGAGFAYDVSPIRMEDGTYRDEIRDGVATAQ
ncbi:MAG: hypothetical protein EBQ99_05245 [Planctomycetes bacterium]|jgi:hypothetical protein|nr:hypothetical protein [Planctomycetota bacterium]